MANINNSWWTLNSDKLTTLFQHLSFRLQENYTKPVEIVVCGGSALILSGLVVRTTMDVDIVALLLSDKLVSPDPLPADLVKAALEVAEDFNLAENWLNNGPSQGEGGLFQLGLPEGFKERLHSYTYGEKLTVHIIDRVDQIHFKLYASADRGGYHVDDLIALKPTDQELFNAARWAKTHDISEGFKLVLKDLLRKLGYEATAEKL
ncbi:hypothetical protein ACFL27_07880 [candidate division CSSED10-310 bacterium]|uniref:Nucleotidyl transferase AbiEii/AbiGii toxin family protein n=1 Tax=candidate division CSSED10-310 bacterium TaxID=2855610 RepID=A0ABV6YVJ8_UNCC1